MAAVMPDVGITAGTGGHGLLRDRHLQSAQGQTLQRRCQAIAIAEYQLSLRQGLAITGPKHGLMGVGASGDQTDHPSLIGNQGTGEIAEHPVGSDHQRCRRRGRVRPGGQQRERSQSGDAQADPAQSETRAEEADRQSAAGQLQRTITILI